MKRLIFLIACSLLVSSCAQDFQERFGSSSSGKKIFTEKDKYIPKKQEDTALPKDIADNRSNYYDSNVVKADIKIALLVPLSGKFEDIGKNLFDAAQLALFNINDPTVSIVPIDTKGTPFGAVEATKEAIDREVHLILGPVFGKSAKTIAPIANKNKLNFISFSNDKTLSNTGAFAIGFIPEQQIQRAVQYSIDRGIEDFATIAPNNSYGAITAKVLRETINESGNASVLKTEIYRLGKQGQPVNLKNHVSSAHEALMKNISPKHFKQNNNISGDTSIKFPRGLLLPESKGTLENISTILTELDFNNKKVQILGSGKWLFNDDILSDPNLDGAWFASPPRENRIRFENEFYRLYEYEPTSIASLAYDGMALAATIARFSTDNSRFDRTELTNPKGFVGIDGIFRLKPDGLTERGLSIVQVQDGEFVIIESAPDRFNDIEYISNEETIN